MSSRLLIVPAAGLGTRLGGTLPKLLVPVAGVPMIDRLLAMFAGFVSQAVVVVHPMVEDVVKRHLEGAPVPVATIVQQQPTGMLDAIMLAGGAVQEAGVTDGEVWIVWCDQVAIHPQTIRRLAALTAERHDAAVVMPTVSGGRPYTHLQRNAEGRITAILHRREGDAMPDMGESDMGLFALPGTSFIHLLSRYAEEPSVGDATRERNFLPFIAWAAATHPIVTFPAVDAMEARGVNTPDDLRAVERYLDSREPDRR
jgi:bifunctional UDP-N-acetylglucosamine pyrophosphorylase / glucosamine-1-phosphate N-acetyltransferase